MLELYQKEECPYCAKVRQFLSDNCIDFISRSCPKSCRVQREKLLELGGKEQVPFLVDPERNVSMYESDDIIVYIKEHYLKT